MNMSSSGGTPRSIVRKGGQGDGMKGSLDEEDKSLMVKEVSHACWE